MGEIVDPLSRGGWNAEMIIVSDAPGRFLAPLLWAMIKLHHFHFFHPELSPLKMLCAMQSSVIFKFQIDF